MGEDFGGDLRFSSGQDLSIGANLGSGAPLDLSPQGPRDPAPDEPPAATAPQQPQGSGQTFGGMLRNILPGPNYRAPDPATSTLDQSADLLEQRVKRATSIATNPLAQFFSPESVQKARDFVPQAAEQLQKIQQQKSAIAAGRVQADVLGLSPGEASDQASQDDRLQIATAKALKGDMRAFQGISAVAPERAAAIAPQVHEVVAGHLEKAQLAFDSLAGMQNQGQYQAKLQQLRQDGTLTDLESLGMKVPPTFDTFNATKSQEGLALRNARIGIENVRQKLEERNTYQPMEKKEAETYDGRVKTVFGDNVSAGPWSRNGASGTRGQVINGGADPNDLGKKFTLATPDQRKAIKEEFDGAVPKEDVEKYRAFNRTYELATKDAKGKPMADGKINTNPNVQQGIAEGLASMLRGGSGGANVGLLKIELMKRGWAQTAIDGFVSNYAGTLNTMFKDADKPYLSQQTQKQIRDVMDVLKTYNDTNVGDRVTSIAQRAGALGLDSAAIGLGKNEATGVIGDALEAGRQAQITRMKPNWQAIGGGDGVMQIGAQRPGATGTALPPGTQPANQLPGAAPLLTPVQQAQPSPAPQAQQPSGPGPAVPSPPTQPAAPGPAQPLTIAGQQVNAPQLPAGMTPDYFRKTQRIESGNEKDPWKAGSGLSSAGGAFQFIRSTWAADKPPGAPDSAKDATPQQQIDATATRAAKNAAALTRAGLPVNDTNAYITHNLGEGAGPKLLQADPNTDARSVVGEAAARNNPMFFRGRPTVATVLARYQAEMDKPDTGGAKPLPGSTPAGGAPADSSTPASGGGSLMSRVAGVLGDAAISSVPGGAFMRAAWGMMTPEQRQKAKDVATDNLPAIGSTVGAIGGGAIGSAVPGAGTVGGTVVGGAAGGAAGQSLKDYLKGGPQQPLEIAKQGALGGVLGVMPAGRPILGTAARVLGSGAVEAGADVAEKGEVTPDAVDAGMHGMVGGVGGELFGRALGMGLHKVYSLFTPDAQKAVQAAAKKYYEASQVLKSEPNRIPGAGGTEVPNPKYLAAEQAHGEAETAIKEMLPNAKPEEVAYAHRVTEEGIKKQPAQAAKPLDLEKENIGQGYRQLESEVADKGVGAPKAAPKLTDGPIAAVENKQVSKQHAELAERTEMAITAPAASWQEKWVQLKDARSALLEAERDAMTSTATGRSKTAQDMRALANTVRVQQEKAAKYVFGEADGKAFMDRLSVLDTRYRNFMETTGAKPGEHTSDAIVRAATLKGSEGREVDKRFRAFAHDDPDALAAWDAMRRQGPNVERDVKNLVAIERIPVLGKLYSAAKLAAGFNQWMRERTAGSPVKFSDIIKTGDGGAQATRDVAGSAGARAAVQSDAPNAGP